MVEELEKAGHQVVGLSRSSGVDLTTGEGLEAGLLGADVCVDVSMPVPAEGEDLVESLRKVSERIMAACEKAGVGHLVFLSITNLDNPHVAGFEYYQGKFAQEQVLEDSALPTSIVHSAQWMEFVLNPAAVEEGESEVKVQDWLIQPIAMTEVATVIADVVDGQPGNRAVAGPEQIRLPELTRRLLAAPGDEREVTVVDAVLPYYSDGSLLVPEDAELVRPTPKKWIAQRG